MAQAGAHATANAHQTNIGIFDQAATQIAGTGGDGGDWNAAMGGSVGVFGAIGSDVNPINIAAAGIHGTADAHQSNTVQFLQGASQAAGGAVMAATAMRRLAEACPSPGLARPTTRWRQQRR
jgi:hypothetical protein